MAAFREPVGAPSRRKRNGWWGAVEEGGRTRGSTTVAGQGGLSTRLHFLLWPLSGRAGARSPQPPGGPAPGVRWESGVAALGPSPRASCGGRAGAGPLGSQVRAPSTDGVPGPTWEGRPPPWGPGSSNLVLFLTLWRSSGRFQHLPSVSVQAVCSPGEGEVVRLGQGRGSPSPPHPPQDPEVQLRAGRRQGPRVCVGSRRGLMPCGGVGNGRRF